MTMQLGKEITYLILAQKFDNRWEDLLDYRTLKIKTTIPIKTWCIQNEYQLIEVIKKF